MATTGHTPNYDLSQYAPGDVTSYLTNYNSDMLKIDTGIAQAKVEAVQGVNDAAGALRAAQAADANATAAMNRANTAYTEAQSVKNSLVIHEQQFTFNDNAVNPSFRVFYDEHYVHIEGETGLSASPSGTDRNSNPSDNVCRIIIGTAAGNPMRLPQSTITSSQTYVRGGLNISRTGGIESSSFIRIFYDGSTTNIAVCIPAKLLTEVANNTISIAGACPR